MMGGAPVVRHRLYGLLVETDRPLPAVAPVDEEGDPDLRVWMGRVPEEVFPPGASGEPWYASPRRTPRDEPTLVVHRRADGGFRLRYADGCEYHVDAAGTGVACTWPEAFTLEDAATYLMGPVLALVLRLRGIPSLHASAVAIDGLAVALAGPAASGKSTTAAALAARGHPLVADDVLGLRGAADGILVQPAYPQLRLWPDAVAALFGPGAALPPLTPNWEKRGLRLREGFDPRPLPLGRVYLLCDRESGAEAPRLEPMGAMDALMALVPRTCATWFPDPESQARELEVMHRVARTVPAAWAIPSADPSRLDELCGMIEADVRGSRG